MVARSRWVKLARAVLAGASVESKAADGAQQVEDAPPKQDVKPVVFGLVNLCKGIPIEVQDVLKTAAVDVSKLATTNSNTAE